MKEPVMQMYFVAMVLPPHLDEKILSHKKLVFEKFGCKVGLKSPAHITLVPPFWMEEENEPELQGDIDLLSKGFQPFAVSTNDFSAFRPRTIFVDVKANPNLNLVKKATDNFFKQKTSYKIRIDNRPFHPHITIATRDLHKKAFYEAWQIFSGKPFKEEWIATDLSVLRHNKKNWDVIHSAYFLEA